jgi:hypothetical protein
MTDLMQVRADLARLVEPPGPWRLLSNHISRGGVLGGHASGGTTSVTGQRRLPLRGSIICGGLP